MRLSIISDEISQDADVAARTASASCFGGLEIRSAYGVTPHHLSDVELDRVRTVVLGHGLAVSGFDPPALKCALPRTDAELTAVRELVVDSIRRAERLGAPFVRIFTFYRSGDPDPMLAASVAREVLSGLTHGEVPLIVETGMRTNTPTMRHVLAFLDALGDDHTGILWDPGNSVFSGWDTSPFPADYLAGQPDPRYQWNGSVKGIPKNTSTQISYEGCLALCGHGNDYYAWSQASQTITTWVLPIVGIILQAPFESNAFWTMGESQHRRNHCTLEYHGQEFLA